MSSFMLFSICASYCTLSGEIALLGAGSTVAVGATIVVGVSLTSYVSTILGIMETGSIAPYVAPISVAAPNVTVQVAPQK